MRSSQSPSGKLRNGQSVMVVSSTSHVSPSKPPAQNNRHKRAGTYVFILLLVFTISWTPLIILLINDFKVHAFADETLVRNLRDHQCYGEPKFINATLRYLNFRAKNHLNSFKTHCRLSKMHIFTLKCASS